MIPYAGPIAAAVALGCAAWGGWQVRDWRADAEALERERSEAQEAHRRAENALRSAQQFEEVRDAIQRDLRASRARLAAALAAPVPQCPAVAVGDVVVPAAALAGVRVAAGEQPADADSGEPRPTVPVGAGAP